MSRIFPLSPAHGGGQRAILVLNERAEFDRLRRFAEVDIHASDERYRAPLVRHAQRLARALGPHGEVVLLGSIATGKYILPLQEVLGSRLYVPSELVGRGDMSRGSLLLRHARAQLELDYVQVLGAESARGAKRGGHTLLTGSSRLASLRRACRSW